jgi:hypothetical protein
MWYIDSNSTYLLLTNNNDIMACTTACARSSCIARDWQVNMGHNRIIAGNLTSEVFRRGQALSAHSQNNYYNIS